MTTSEMKVRDGTRLAYEIHGAPDGRPRLVLIHSPGMGGSFWKSTIERLGMAGVA